MSKVDNVLIIDHVQGIYTVNIYYVISIFIKSRCWTRTFRLVRVYGWIWVLRNIRPDCIVVDVNNVMGEYVHRCSQYTWFNQWWAVLVSLWLKVPNFSLLCEIWNMSLLQCANREPYPLWPRDVQNRWSHHCPDHTHIIKHAFWCICASCINNDVLWFLCKTYDGMFRSMDVDTSLY